MSKAYWATAGAAAAVACAVASAQEAPRTAWGDPDLRGTYTSDNSIGVPFERPAQFGERAELTDEEYAAKVDANEAQIAKDLNPEPESEFSAEDPSAINASRHWLERPETPSRATSLVVDPPNGRLPELTPAGQQRAAERRARRPRGQLPASYTDFTNYDRCLTRGVVGSILPVIYGNGTQIVQAPGVVVIRNEMIHEARVIPLDGSAHLGDGVHMWMGDSRGRFDGDTLVIETTNFTDRTGLGGNGNGAVHSENMKLVEKLRRVDADTLRYEFTVDDPETYTKPWTVAFDLDGKPGYEIYEYACHEGNLGLANMLSAARAEERAAAQATKR
ncbi:MAG TPA: hypothetical protein VFL84_05225 [Gammaproteobacteria bacterium]|nr:hypothetical protein [Gammaproteobacteria bacterium]